MYDVIIIGAGPAGLTAGLYAGRSLLKTLLLEKMVPGGRILMSETIENYPGCSEGFSTHELMARMADQVRHVGVEIKTEEATDIDLSDRTVTTTEGLYQAKTVIIAAGSYPRKLNVQGEDLFTGRGVSYCATCDAPFYKGKHVIIVGGGNSVAEEALYLCRFAERVTVVHRRDELRASPILQGRLKSEPKIHFKLKNIVTVITGDKKVSAVTLKDLSLNTESAYPCDGVFIYIGYEPDTAIYKNKLNLDPAGFIITDPAMQTSVPGIFACGDCRQKTLYQVITACGDGAVAADSAYKHISNL
jgi:thioredoxin reductase (NADPH)